MGRTFPWCPSPQSLANPYQLPHGANQLHSVTPLLVVQFYLGAGKHLKWSRVAVIYVTMAELGRLALFAMGFGCLWALVGHGRGIPFAAVRERASKEQEVAERIVARDRPMLGNLLQGPQRLWKCRHQEAVAVWLCSVFSPP